MSIPVPLHGFGSGGAPLNFNVAGGLTQPADPKENTIWVRTSTNVSSWTLAASAPSQPESGMVWIEISLSGVNAFNALKKNGIVLCPASAWQYLSGEWTELTAKIYQGGVWETWFTYLYNKGDEFTDLTGGWNAYAYKTSTSGSTATKPTVTKGSTSIKIAFSSSSTSAGALFTEKTVDLTNIATLEIDVIDVGSAADTVFLGITADKKNNYSPPARKTIYEKGTAILDVSEFTGYYYVYVSMQGASKNHVEFDSIRMR